MFTKQEQIEVLEAQLKAIREKQASLEIQRFCVEAGLAKMTETSTARKGIEICPEGTCDNPRPTGKFDCGEHEDGA